MAFYELDDLGGSDMKEYGLASYMRPALGIVTHLNDWGSPRFGYYNKNGYPVVEPGSEEEVVAWANDVLAGRVERDRRSNPVRPRPRPAPAGGGETQHTIPTRSRLTSTAITAPRPHMASSPERRAFSPAPSRTSLPRRSPRRTRTNRSRRLCAATGRSARSGSATSASCSRTTSAWRSAWCVRAKTETTLGGARVVSLCCCLSEPPGNGNERSAERFLSLCASLHALTPWQDYDKTKETLRRVSVALNTTSPGLLLVRAPPFIPSPIANRSLPSTVKPSPRRHHSHSPLTLPIRPPPPSPPAAAASRSTPQAFQYATNENFIYSHPDGTDWYEPPEQPREVGLYFFKGTPQDYVGVRLTQQNVLRYGVLYVLRRVHELSGGAFDLEAAKAAVPPKQKVVKRVAEDGTEEVEGEDEVEGPGGAAEPRKDGEEEQEAAAGGAGAADAAAAKESIAEASGAAKRAAEAAEEARKEAEDIGRRVREAKEKLEKAAAEDKAEL